MNFRRHRHREEPEINFIPLIDLLLVILIFLMVTTTYARFSELEVNLPQASGAEMQKDSRLRVDVSASGSYAVDGQAVAGRDVAQLGERLKREASGKNPAPVVVINADAKASHQAVVTVMEAARLAGLLQLTFATQQGTP